MNTSTCNYNSDGFLIDKQYRIHLTQVMTLMKSTKT